MNRTIVTVALALTTATASLHAASLRVLREAREVATRISSLPPAEVVRRGIEAGHTIGQFQLEKAFRYVARAQGVLRFQRSHAVTGFRIPPTASKLDDLSGPARAILEDASAGRIDDAFVRAHRDDYVIFRLQEDARGATKLEVRVADPREFDVVHAAGEQGKRALQDASFLGLYEDVDLLRRRSYTEMIPIHEIGGSHSREMVIEAPGGFLQTKGSGQQAYLARGEDGYFLVSMEEGGHLPRGYVHLTDDLAAEAEAADAAARTLSGAAEGAGGLFGL